jgi:hypothetical protein
MLLAYLFLTFRIFLTSLGLVSMLGVAFAFAFGFSWGHGLRSQRSKKKLPHSLGEYRPIYNPFICILKRRLICLFQLVMAMGWPCGLAALSEKGMHDQVSGRTSLRSTLYLPKMVLHCASKKP